MGRRKATPQRLPRPDRRRAKAKPLPQRVQKPSVMPQPQPPPHHRSSKAATPPPQPPSNEHDNNPPDRDDDIDKAERYAELILRSGRVIYRHYKNSGSVKDVFKSSDAVYTLAEAAGPLVLEVASDVVKKLTESMKEAVDAAKTSVEATKAAAEVVKESAEAMKASAEVAKKSTEATKATADVVKTSTEATKAKANASILPDVMRLLPGAIDVATTIKAAVGENADDDPAKMVEKKFWRPVKAAALLAADIASISREAVTKAIPGTTTLTATMTFNECAIKFAKGPKLAKIGAMKFNPVEAVLGGAHAVYNDVVNGTFDNTAKFAGGFVGKMGGQLAGRALGAAIGSAVPIVGTAIGVAAGGVVGGLIGEKVGKYLGKKVKDGVGYIAKKAWRGAKKAWGWLKSWF